MTDLDQFRQTYITECLELLDEMEERLLALNVDAPDNEELNAIFRCAHSIKGGSGAFGFDFITNFTHALEALLDSLREGKVLPTREVVDVLLKATDIVAQMVDAASDGGRPQDNFGAEIKALLEKFANGADAPCVPVAAEPIEASEGERQWRIDFTPHQTLFSTGNEPLLILRELGRLGAMEVSAVTSRVPPIDGLDATACFIGWSLRLRTAAPLSAIREAFEFVEDYCDLKIIDTQAAGSPSPPHWGERGWGEGGCGESKQTFNFPPHPAPLPPRGGRGSPNDLGGTKNLPKKGESSVAEVQAARVGQTTSIRVDLEKVDRLVNMVGELVITEAMLHAQTRGFAVEKFAGLLRGIDELAQHTRELQEAVMSVRMQPVKSVFARMPRIVRDIAEQLGKNIRLEMEGENTEVDKTVIEQLADPLTHMIRNSCDHGIEMPEERGDRGKPAQGVIVLSAYHRGGRIMIEVRDDGAGIDRARVLAKAREKGLVPAEVAPSDEEIDNIVFMAGFSTAEQVTNVSGRGVGMDVVKRNIESLGGTVRVTNEPGRGSVFTVSLPLTLAILDGMIVRVGAEHYIIPITNILETLRPKADEVRHVEGHSDVINVRGEFVSVIYLHRTFNIQDAERDPSKALVVLVESNRHKIGLVVDELIGQQQVVIKSLEANADPVKGVSGATILGDGRVSLILEVNELDQIGEGKSENLSRELAA